MATKKKAAKKKLSKRERSTRARVYNPRNWTTKMPGNEPVYNLRGKFVGEVPSGKWLQACKLAGGSVSWFHGSRGGGWKRNGGPMPEAAKWVGGGKKRHGILQYDGKAKIHKTPEGHYTVTQRGKKTLKYSSYAQATLEALSREVKSLLKG